MFAGDRHDAKMNYFHSTVEPAFMEANSHGLTLLMA